MLNASPSSPPLWTMPAPPADQKPVVFNQQDMAEACKICVTTVRSLVNKGLLPPPSIKSGKIWLWPKEVWDAWAAKKAKAVR